MKISVAMAYYNGGMYIEEQMDTILTQLGAQDEVIVSVDGASDGSKPLLLKMAEEDKRIHVIKGPGTLRMRFVIAVERLFIYLIRTIYGSQIR